MTISEFLQQLTDGEFDKYLPRIEAILHERTYAIKSQQAKDELDQIAALVDLVATMPDYDRYQRASAVWNRLARWKRENGTGDERLKPLAEKLLSSCFSFTETDIDEFNAQEGIVRLKK